MMIHSLIDNRLLICAFFAKVICIGVFLGITLVLVGFVARMIQRRKRRRMIAQRNFEILYQDFGVQSEKTKKWLADFNYQSSIL